MLVFDRDGQRYYLRQDAKRYQYLEHVIDAYALVVILSCILCAFWIGRLTAARVIAPITRLADAVERKEMPFPFQDARDEIGVLARAFAQHSDEAQQYLQRERCFVGDASHELRTPLAIIAGAAETIAHQLPDGSHLHASAERIMRTTQEMQRQLTCLLLLSRDPQRLEKEDVALRTLIEECISRCPPWLANKPVVVVLDAPQDPRVHTNAELARSVVWNLLRNACQYTDTSAWSTPPWSSPIPAQGCPPASIPSSFSVSPPARARVAKGLACPSCSGSWTTWGGTWPSRALSMAAASPWTCRQRSDRVRSHPATGANPDSFLTLPSQCSAAIHSL